MRAHRRLVGLLLATACLAAPGAAGAATLSFSGAISPSDPTASAGAYSSPTSTCGGVSPATFGAPSYDAYALRNTGAADCVTVRSSVPVCGEPLAPTTYLGTFAPKDAGTGFVGANEGLGCSQDSSHVAAIAAGRTLVVAVHSVDVATTTTDYTLDVTGASLAPANAVNVTGGGLPKGNTLNLNASSLKDGSAPEGTVSVSSTGGQSYSGPVLCLRVDGDRSSVIMRITGGNAPAKYTHAAFWLEESPTTSGGQRNSLLTEARLSRLYGSVCPDPNAPVGGSFNPMTAGYASVIDTPAAVDPPA